MRERREHLGARHVGAVTKTKLLLPVGVHCLDRPAHHPRKRRLEAPELLAVWVRVVVAAPLVTDEDHAAAEIVRVLDELARAEEILVRREPLDEGGGWRLERKRRRLATRRVVWQRVLRFSSTQLNATSRSPQAYLLELEKLRDGQNKHRVL